MHCPLSGNVTDVLLRDQFVSILRSADTGTCCRRGIFDVTKRLSSWRNKTLSLRLCSPLLLFLNVNGKSARLATQIPVPTVATVWWHTAQVYWKISGWIWEPRVFLWLKWPYWPGSRHYRDLAIALRHSTFGRNSVDKWWAPRRFLVTDKQHSLQINPHDTGRNRTRNPSTRGVADLRLRPRGHRDRQSKLYLIQELNWAVSKTVRSISSTKFYKVKLIWIGFQNGHICSEIEIRGFKIMTLGSWM